jgi:hypothetical protein
VGRAQLTQAPVQAVLQQIPSAQKPEPHSWAQSQAAPTPFLRAGSQIPSSGMVFGFTGMPGSGASAEASRCRLPLEPVPAGSVLHPAAANIPSTTVAPINLIPFPPTTGGFVRILRLSTGSRGSPSKSRRIDALAMSSPRPVLRALAVLAALLLVAGVIGVRRLRSARPSTAAVPGGHSPWVVPRPVPRLRVASPALPAGAPDAAATVPGKLLVVQVEDVEGGPIPGATVSAGDRAAGVTDERGILRLVTGQGIADDGELVVRGPGYGVHRDRYHAPGQIRCKLIVGSVVSGRVVRDATDVGMAGLVVTAGEGQAVSDAGGRFTIRDLPPQLARLEARGDGWYGALPQPIALGQGRTIEALRVPVSRAFAIRGRVLREGRPAGAGTEVSGGGSQALTDEAGRYALLGVPPGTYGLEASPREPGAAVFSMGPRTTARVVDRDVDADIELGPRARLLVEVVDGAGRPQAGVRLRVEEQRNQDGQGVSLQNEGCTTGADGHCAFIDLLPGPVSVSLELVEPEKRQVTVPVAVGHALRFVVPWRGRLDGRIVDEDGRPARPRMLELRAPGSQHGQWETSALDGTFSFERLAPGRYQLESVDRTAEPRIPARELSVPEGGRTEPVVITVPGGSGRLAGRVLEPSGAPAPDVLVSYRRRDPNTFHGGGLAAGDDVVTTDAAGGFSFEGAPRAAHLTISAYRITGEMAEADDVTVGSAPPTLRLVARASLRVIARGQEQGDGWTIVTVHDGERTLGFALERQPGTPVHVDNLPPGRWAVDVRRGARTRDLPAAFVGGQLTDLTVDLDAASDQEPAAP